MAKKNKEPAGEQLDLIDVAPENAKKLIGIAKRYKTAQTKRVDRKERKAKNSGSCQRGKVGSMVCFLRLRREMNSSKSKKKTKKRQSNAS